MKTKDILQKLKETSKKVRFVVPESVDVEGMKNFNKVCEQSKDFEDFINKYTECEFFKQSQGAYEIYKNFFPSMLTRKLKDFLGEECKVTESDVGSLKIGNKDFSFFIPNGYGDGITLYAIYDKEPEWSFWFGDSTIEFFEVKKDNSVAVFLYDCGNEISEFLKKGKYIAKAYEGVVLIYKIANVKE